jgi:nitroimidazol reductase NimA-like FMN-containing flavoprotein (pyridoxamine 5'-phosphate oxidase superfamily)
MPMTPEEIDAFLDGVRLCHFATVDDRGEPRVRPLWYLWRDGAFWLTTRLGARHTGRDLASTPVVSLSIASDDRPYRAVVARGPIEVIGRDPELLEAISTRYGEREGLAWLSRALNEDDRTVLKMVPTELLSWDYGRGDSARQNRGESMRTT